MLQHTDQTLQQSEKFLSQVTPHHREMWVGTEFIYQMTGSCNSCAKLGLVLGLR